MKKKITKRMVRAIVSGDREWFASKRRRSRDDGTIASAYSGIVDRFYDSEVTTISYGELRIISYHLHKGELCMATLIKRLLNEGAAFKEQCELSVFWTN